MSKTFKEMTLGEFLEVASSNEPTPGGGAISAVAGALGTSMALMAANFTTDPKKFADRQEAIKGMLVDLARSRDQLMELAGADARGFKGIGEAYALPKKTDQEKARRKQAIQDALVGAMQAPRGIIDVCAGAMGVIDQLADVANINLISDVGVAAVLCEAASRAARLNVEINLAFIKDGDLVERTRLEVERQVKDIRSAHERVIEKANRAING